jgi:hypothetical protein
MVLVILTHISLNLIARLRLAAGPFVRIYYSSQFAPLVIFFLLFLAVVKNTKVPHFVRFNCMQVPNMHAAENMLLRMLLRYVFAYQAGIVQPAWEVNDWTITLCLLQSVMIDIVVMLFTIIRSYFPSELRWTAVLTVSSSKPFGP